MVPDSCPLAVLERSLFVFNVVPVLGHTVVTKQGAAGVLLKVSIVLVKDMIKSTLERRGYSELTGPHRHCQEVRKSGQGLHVGAWQEPRSRN